MKRIVSTALGLLSLTGAAWSAEVTLRVQYPLPQLLKPVMEESAKRFTAENPDVRIDFAAPAENYPAALQQRLREGIVGTMPDVAFHGLNNVRPLADRGLPVALEPFIAGETDWTAQGFDPAALSVGQVDGRQYGLPYLIATQIIYYNPDLVRKAGGDPENFPKTWDEIIALGAKINDPRENVSGLWFFYDLDTWTWQGLVLAHGGRLMSEDDKRVAFGGPAGQAAIRVLHRAAKDARMVDFTRAQGTQAFAAGKLGIMVYPAIFVISLPREIGGRFGMRTAPLPMPDPNGRLPAGGNVAMIFSKDPERQKAAWRFVKFMGGPVGQTLMAKATGSSSSNTLPLRDPAQLGSFYDSNPLLKADLSQMPRVAGWYVFPGPNGSKIDDVIRDHLKQVATLRAEPDAALAAMVRDVEALLPTGN